MLSIKCDFNHGKLRRPQIPNTTQRRPPESHGPMGNMLSLPSLWSTHSTSGSSVATASLNGNLLVGFFIWAMGPALLGLIISVGRKGYVYYLGDIYYLVPMVTCSRHRQGFLRFGVILSKLFWPQHPVHTASRTLKHLPILCESSAFYV